MGDNLNDKVARAIGWIDYPTDSAERGKKWHTDKNKAPFGTTIYKENWTPSTDWSQGGPLIEKYRICLAYVETKKGIKWYANISIDDDSHVGSTPLIAAMSALVHSKRNVIK